MQSSEFTFSPTEQAANIREASDLLKLLSHPLRLSILCTIIAREEVGAGQIVEALSDMSSPSQIAQYLTLMKQQGLISSRRDGQFVYYSPASEAATDIVAILYRHFCR